MTTQTIGRSTFAGLPRVNLLPPEIFEKRRLRRLQTVMAGVVTGAVLVVAAGTVWAHSGVTSAQTDLDAATAQRAALTAQLAKYRDVNQTDAKVSSYETMLRAAMGGEVLWSRYLNDLSLRIPDNVWLTTMSVNAVKTAGAPATAPATTSGVVGNVTFAGTALTHDDVATWLEALAREPGFTDPYFSKSNEGKIGDRVVVNFDSTVKVNDEALSKRYTKAGS